MAIGSPASMPLLGAIVVLAMVSTLLSACVPTDPETRRAAYLDCARGQGVAVRDGTILSSGAGDLARLDACEPLPR